MFDNIPENNSYSYIDRKDLTAIRTGLRQSFIRSKYRAEFMRTKRVETVQYKKNGDVAKRPMVRFQCVECSCMFAGDKINVDHIKKVGSFLDIMDIENFFFRIWCDFDNLQILCIECHTLKTKRERRLDALSKKYL